MFLGSVVGLALAQDAGDEFLCNFRVFGFLLFILLAFLPRLLQAAFRAPRLMRRGRPPKPPKEIVEGADTRRIAGFKTTENGIDGYGAKRTNPVIDAHP